jgi:hypothetical protein
MPKKQLLLFAFCLFFINTLMAQSLPNAGFENWTPSGSPPPFDWEDPTGWRSSNAVTEFVSAGCRKSTNKHNGTYAVELKATNVQTKTTVLCNGQPPLDYANYTLDIIRGGTPITSRPQNFMGYYKLLPDSASDDSVWAVVIMKRYNGGNIDTVGMGSMVFSAASNYTLFSIPITYTDTVAPDSIVTAFYYKSSISGGLPVGALYLDDMIIGGAAGTDKSQVPVMAEIYPNPASTEVTIGLPGQVGETCTMKVWSTDGRYLMEVNYLNDGSDLKLDLSGFDNGIYFIELTNARSGRFTKKIQVQK